MDKLNNRVPLNLDEKTLTELDAYRTSLESHSGLRVSRSNAVVSLIRTALASAHGGGAQRPAPHVK